MSFIKEKYKEVAKSLKSKFGYKNELEIPRLEKICLNVAFKSADVDSEDSRAALRYGNKVEHLLTGGPLVLVHHLLFYNRYHGVSTPEGECANLKEGFEQCQIEILHSKTRKCTYFLSSIHLRALTKASIHGVTSSLRCAASCHPSCHGKMARSRCGIIAR